LLYWIIVISVGAVATMINGMLSGVTSERIGKSIRSKLFSSLIYKDTAFYDENRIGDLRKISYV
jgi:ABC-type multidrug transport system fused ATPase/permease subunit